MNTRHEAILWSTAITTAIALGLAVVWAAIALAFSRPNLAPLYFAAAPYRQDDYSAEGLDVARLNPLDPGLEQEVIIEDQARGNPVFHVNDLNPASTKIPLPPPINTSVAPPINTSVPPSISTPIPPPASTPIPPPQPTKPEKPDKPDKPDKPEKPEKPDKPNKPDKPGKSPKST